MRDFTAVSPALWRSTRFLELSDSDAWVVYLYFLTGPHQTSAGYSRIPDQYGAGDLGWDLARYRQARNAVVKSGMVFFDAETSELFIDNWFPFSGALGDTNQAGIDKILVRIQSADICDGVSSQMEADIERRVQFEREKADRKNRRKTQTPPPSANTTDNSRLATTRLVQTGFNRTG